MPKKKTPAPPRPVPLTPSDVRHIRELWLQGLSVAELAEKFEQSHEFLWGVLEGERPSATPESPRVIECSFCGGTQHECVMLIAGPRAFICDQCVKLCLEIIAEERPGYVRIEIGPPDGSPATASNGGKRQG